MNEHDRKALEQLASRQWHLEQELALLKTDLRALRTRLEEKARNEHARPEAQLATTPRPQETIPLPPPIISEFQESREPGVTEPSPVFSEEFREAEPFEPAIVAPPLPPVQEETTAQPEPPKSFELRLGTYWLVRVGIVMLLTGLVFFGNYAYQSFISKLGAGGKIALMYLGSAILLVFGSWWQRRAARPNLRNFAEVLFAGGMAAVYFTTYAAHHIEHLRIISSPVVDGILLVAWAAFIVWIADRRKSEVLAMFAIGLAYYASVVTRAGHFTAWSNLILACATVAFLVRNRWAALSVVSLIATYAGYAFWRFFAGSGHRLDTPPEALQYSAYFLCAYWVVFTAAVFLAKAEKFSGPNRAAFLTANNAAFFTLFVLTMLETRTAGFWKVCLVYGTVLLGLAAAARRMLAADPLAWNSYLTQGLLLITVGFIARFSGFHLALLLAVQSVVQLTLGEYRASRILRIAGWVSGVLATLASLNQLIDGPAGSLWLPVGVGAILMVNVFLSHGRQPVTEGQLLRFSPSWFTALGLLVWLGGALEHASMELLPLVLIGGGLLLTLSLHVFGIREIALLSQAYLLSGPLLWAILATRPHRPDPFLPWWNPALAAAMILAAMHWWQHQDKIEIAKGTRLAIEGIFAALFVLVLHIWVFRTTSFERFMLWSAGLAVAVTLYATVTRAWMLGAIAQSLTISSVGALAIQFAGDTHPHWAMALAPMAALVILATGVRQRLARRPASNRELDDALVRMSVLYNSVAVAASIFWVLIYVPQREVPWVLFACSATAFAWAGKTVRKPCLYFSGAYALIGLLAFLFWPDRTSRFYLPNLLGIVALAAQEQIARRFPDRYAVTQQTRRLAVSLVCLAFWVLASRYMLKSANGFYLTATWSVVALILFATGVLLRERAYRWFGLAVLTCALTRVVVFDIWKLQTVYQILSFMALGTVLVVLGLVYNKYQDRIKQWL